MAQYQRGCSVPLVYPSAVNDELGSSKVVYNYSRCDMYRHVNTHIAPSIHNHLPPFIKSNHAEQYQFGKLKMDQFENYKLDRLVHLKSAAPSVVELNTQKVPCSRYVHTLTESKPFTCLAVVSINSNPGSLNMIRFNRDQKKTGRAFNQLHPAPAGIFRNVANKKGRISQRAYTQPFLENIHTVEKEITRMTSRRGLGPGSDVTLMVTNDGEIDLFLNYACSCRAHNISLNSAIVFTGSRCIPLHTISHHTISHHITPHNTTHHITKQSDTSHSKQPNPTHHKTIQHNTTLHTLHYATLHHSTLHHATLHHTTRHHTTSQNNTKQHKAYFVCFNSMFHLVNFFP